MTIEWVTGLVRGTFVPVEESPVLRWATVATALGAGESMKRGNLVPPTSTSGACLQFVDCLEMGANKAVFELTGAAGTVILTIPAYPLSTFRLMEEEQKPFRGVQP